MASLLSFIPLSLLNLPLNAQTVNNNYITNSECVVFLSGTDSADSVQPLITSDDGLVKAPSNFHENEVVGAENEANKQNNGVRTHTSKFLTAVSEVRGRWLRSPLFCC